MSPGLILRAMRSPCRCWFRRGLLECECGGDLSNCDLSSISEAEVSLLNIIRRKALSYPLAESNPIGLPQDQLMGMSLRSLLLTIRTIGKHRIMADGTSDRSNEKERSSRPLQECLCSGQQISLSLMEDLGRQLPSEISGGVGKQFGGIYRAPFRSKAMGSPKQTEFLRVAFLDFAMNHWSRGFVDHKIIKKLGGSGSKRFLTQERVCDQDRSAAEHCGPAAKKFDPSFKASEVRSCQSGYRGQ